MTKPELITALLCQSHLDHRAVEAVEFAVSNLFDHMSQKIAHGERIEIRGESDRFDIAAGPMRTE